MGARLGSVSKMAEEKNAEKTQVELATFGAGCYWGTDKYFAKDFSKANPGGVLKTSVGFMGGKNKSPTYQQVCSGASGHVEVAQIEFDPSKASFEDMVKFFFTFHDPTTPNAQGNDSGTQYASVIFCHSDEQLSIAKKVMAEVQGLISAGKVTAFKNKKISTAIVPAEKYYIAHKEHQDYLELNPRGYCNHRIRWKWTSSL